jgi:hypothetical protein
MSRWLNWIRKQGVCEYWTNQSVERSANGFTADRVLLHRERRDWHGTLCDDRLLPGSEAKLAAFRQSILEGDSRIGAQSRHN